MPGQMPGQFCDTGIDAGTARLRRDIHRHTFAMPGQLSSRHYVLTVYIKHCTCSMQ